jgi:glycosyltransferase involved in cell wall biosynthesis
VSHTFIRREILELEQRGHQVLRVSVRRPSSDLVDPLDLEEERRTRYLLAEPAALVGATLWALLTRPVRFARALRHAVRMGLRSDRGIVRHVAYLIEAARVLALTQAYGSELLHAHFGTNSAAVGLLARELGGPPFSFTVHGPDEFDAPVALALADKVAGARSVVAISHYGAAQLMRWSRPDHWDRIAIVRCSIGEYATATTEPIPLKSRAFVCVGRLSAQKGHLLLLDAFADLLASGESASLTLVGDGELRAAVEATVARRGLERHVTLLGWQSGEVVRQQLRNSRALVMPSFAEGLPVAIMEAFALGRPVIATYVGGIPELVEPGRSGWLVPAGSRSALADALREAARASIETLEAMGAEGRRRVHQQHAIADQVDTLLKIWTTAAAQPGA